MSLFACSTFSNESFCMFRLFLMLTGKKIAETWGTVTFLWCLSNISDPDYYTETSPNVAPSVFVFRRQKWCLRIISAVGCVMNIYLHDTDKGMELIRVGDAFLKFWTEHKSSGTTAPRARDLAVSMDVWSWWWEHANYQVTWAVEIFSNISHKELGHC